MAKNEIIRTEYLIIGNSAGGIGAAEAIRGIDKNGSVTIVSEEPYPAYSRLIGSLGKPIYSLKGKATSETIKVS